MARRPGGRGGAHGDRGRRRLDGRRGPAPHRRRRGRRRRSRRPSQWPVGCSTPRRWRSPTCSSPATSPRRRRRVQALVGRDPSGLDAAGVARAVVESVAENTTDAVVAPGRVGRGRRRAGRARPPRRQHARRDGRPPLAALRALRVVGAPASTTSPTPSPPSSARCSSPCGTRAAGGPSAAPSSSTPARHPSPNAGADRSGVRRRPRRDARRRQPLRRRGRGSRSARHRPAAGAGGHRPGRAAAPVARRGRSPAGWSAIDVTARRAGGRGGGPTTGWRRAAS